MTASYIPQLFKNITKQGIVKGELILFIASSGTGKNSFTTEMNSLVYSSFREEIELAHARMNKELKQMGMLIGSLAGFGIGLLFLYAIYS